MNKNRRNFMGWLAGAFAVGATGKAAWAITKEPVKIEIRWGSYHSGGFWTHSMYVDGLKYASLCWLKYDTERGKVFCIGWKNDNIKEDGNQRYEVIRSCNEVILPTLESALQYAEQKVLSYLTHQYQIPFEKIELNVDRTEVIEGVRSEMKSFYNRERMQKELDERAEKEFGFKRKT